MWNTDDPAPQVDNFKSLYKSIPFFITLRKTLCSGCFSTILIVPASIWERVRCLLLVRGFRRQSGLLPDCGRQYGGSAGQLYIPDRNCAPASEVDAGVPSVPLELHDRRGNPGDREEDAGVRHSLRRDPPGYRLHGRLSGVHLEQRPLRQPGKDDGGPGERRFQDRDHHRPRRKAGRRLQRL